MSITGATISTKGGKSMHMLGSSSIAGPPLHSMGNVGQQSVRYERTDPALRTMGLDTDGDGQVDQLMSGTLGVDIDNDGEVDIVITPDELKGIIMARGKAVTEAGMKAQAPRTSPPGQVTRSLASPPGQVTQSLASLPIGPPAPIPRHLPTAPITPVLVSPSLSVPRAVPAPAPLAFTSPAPSAPLQPALLPAAVSPPTPPPFQPMTILPSPTVPAAVAPPSVPSAPVYLTPTHSMPATPPPQARPLPATRVVQQPPGPPGGPQAAFGVEWGPLPPAPHRFTMDTPRELPAPAYFQPDVTLVRAAPPPMDLQPAPVMVQPSYTEMQPSYIMPQQAQPPPSLVRAIDVPRPEPVPAAERADARRYTIKVDEERYKQIVPDTEAEFPYHHPLPGKGCNFVSPILAATSAWDF